MTFSGDRDSSILDEFDDWFESVEINLNSDSSKQDIESTNEQVQEFLDELQDELDKTKTNS